MMEAFVLGRVGCGGQPRMPLLLHQLVMPFYLSRAAGFACAVHSQVIERLQRPPLHAIDIDTSLVAIGSL